MAFDIHSSHRTILLLPLSVYVVLVAVVAWLPAERMLREHPPDEAARFGNRTLVDRGEEVFKAQGCAVCHTQQIRGDERLRVPQGDRWVVPVRPPDRRFGLDEPTRPEDYANASPPLLGTQRTGPDLIGVGDRLPSAAWHYWHLYDPRAVSPGSVMPDYKFLFQVVKKEGSTVAAAPPGTGAGVLVIALVVGLFSLLGWALFGRTRTLLITAALGAAAGWQILRECQLCLPPPEQGEVVEDEIEALGIPSDSQLVAGPDARALVDYVLSLRRPLRKP